jgi:hypothetical protein
MKLEIIALLICSIMGRRRRRLTNEKVASEETLKANLPAD